MIWSACSLAQATKLTRGYQVAQLTVFAAEVTRVSLEVGTEGKLGGQALVPNVEGTWMVLTDNVNLMVGSGALEEHKRVELMIRH